MRGREAAAVGHVPRRRKVNGNVGHCLHDERYGMSDAWVLRLSRQSGSIKGANDTPGGQ